MIMARADVHTHCGLAVENPSESYSIATFSQPVAIDPDTPAFLDWFLTTDELLRRIVRDIKAGELPRVTIVSLSPRLQMLHEYLEEQVT